MVLAVLAGLGGGLAMAAVAAGRRGGAAFDRMVEFADTPDLLVNFCPPGLSEVDEEALADCFTYDPSDERAAVERLPEVETAVRGEFRGATIGRVEEPDRTSSASTAFVLDPGLATVDGHLRVVDGRWFRPGSADEIVVNEFLRDRAGVEVGGEVELAFWAPGELGQAAPDGDRFSGPTLQAEVVGVVRGVRDVAARSGSASFQVDEARAFGDPAMAAAAPGAGAFNGVFVQAVGDDADAATAAIERAFPDRPVNISLATGPDELDPIRSAIDYESAAALAFGALAGLAAAVFAGQAIARQGRREWADSPVLHALGTTRRQAVLAALLRGSVTAVAAALVASTVAAVLSPLGPIGAARAAETDPGPAADGVVLALGAVVVMLVVALASTLPAATAAFRRGRSVSPSGSSPGWLSNLLPPAPMVGLATARSALHPGVGGFSVGSALVAVTVAVGTLAASSTLVASLTRLLDSPDRFGAPWDLSVGGVSASDGKGSATEVSFLSTRPEVAAAAGIVGTDARIGDEIAWVHAFEPILGAGRSIGPTIIGGRDPRAVDEIALGLITMRDLGLEIGDEIEVAPTVSGMVRKPMTVVGTTVVNDTYENSPGRGGVVTFDWIVEMDLDTGADPIVVRLEAGADREAFADALSERTNGQVNGPLPQEAVRNVDRIRGLPSLLAGLVGLLAVATVVHALVLLVRRQRRPLATLRSLGFLRRQAALTMAWCATLLVVPAAAIGVPVGVAAGRWIWRTLAAQIGVSAEPSTPVLRPALAVVVALVIAAVAGAFPAWRATGAPTTASLRAE